MEVEYALFLMIVACLFKIAIVSSGRVTQRTVKHLLGVALQMENINTCHIILSPNTDAYVLILMNRKSHFEPVDNNSCHVKIFSITKLFHCNDFHYREYDIDQQFQ